jgi:hypothetical protein
MEPNAFLSSLSVSIHTIYKLDSAILNRWIKVLK